MPVPWLEIALAAATVFGGLVFARGSDYRNREADRGPSRVGVNPAVTAKRRRERQSSLVANGWIEQPGAPWQRIFVGTSVGLRWLDDDDALTIIIPHAFAGQGAALGFHARSSSGVGIGDPAFDAVVVVSDPERGGLSRAVIWLDPATRDTVRKLVLAGWTSTPAGWEQRFGRSANTLPPGLHDSIKQVLPLTESLRSPPPSPSAALLVERALHDPARGVRVTALEILYERWQSAPATAELLARLVAAPPREADEHRAFIDLLAHAPVPGSEPVLIACIDGDDEALRRTAADALARVGTPLAVPALRRRGLDWAIEAIQARVGGGAEGGLSLSDPNAAGGLALAGPEPD
ncbi:MAG: HEAT repeat domain-containing protein [Myxococcota bacterium]